MSSFLLILTSMHPISILLLFLFFFLLYKYLYSSSTQPKNPPPSPPKLPIVGHLHKLGLHPHLALQALSRKYGEFMLIYLGNKPALVVSSANAAREILKTHDALLSNRPTTTIATKLSYNCQDLAFAPYGDYWRQMKSLFVLQLLNSKRVRSYRHIRAEETALLIESVRNSAKDADLGDLFITLTNDVICRVAFGRKYTGDKKGKKVDFKAVLMEFMELLGVFNVEDFIPWLGWTNRFTGLNERVDKSFKTFNLVIEEIISEHTDGEKIESNDSSTDGEKTKDLVDLLLDIQRENLLGFPIEMDSIKALIVNTFAAGTHTTATLMEWAMAELIKSPRVMDKLQKEVREVVGGNEEIITEECLEKMKYLKAVLKETLRLHPPIPLLAPRESTQDMKISGYNIPNKTTIIINSTAIQRDPNVWEEPDEFLPERFLKSTLDFKGLDYELIPFGGGRRICPGITFAMVNIELVMANLMYLFNWSLPGGAPNETLDMTEGTGLAIRIKKSLHATATPYICN